MENAPVINVGGASPAPGADIDVWNRYENWLCEVYLPLLTSKIPGATGADRYWIIKENPLYPSRITIRHFQNLKMSENSNKLPERIAVEEEMATWVKRHVIDYVWATSYILIKSFRSEPSDSPGVGDTKIENAPIMHIESYRLRPEDEEKYVKWLNDYGFNVLIPLFVGLPGLKGYDCYKHTGLKGISEVREWEYPPYLSIVYFENVEAFENYEKSRELVAYQKALRNVFPNGLNLRWYVEYQLVRSWRK
jgi:hypothetical protein